MKVLAMVLAGGKGSRLYPLTEKHAKPALPFANGYRIVDFVLSNLVNSEISSIYVLAQYKPNSLIDHLTSTWSPRFNGRENFLKVILPGACEGQGSFRGTADAVYQNLNLIDRHSPDLVAVFAADHVYRMDVRQMIGFHLGSKADVTVAASRVRIEKASAFGVIVTGRDGGIREFQEKPEHPVAIPTDPTCAYASMGNYLFEPGVLAEVLEEAARYEGKDFGLHIMPRLPGRYKAFAYDFSSNLLPGIAPHEERGYWRDVGSLEALAAAQKDIMGPQPHFELHNSKWPIHGAGYQARTVKDDNVRVSNEVFNAASRSGRGSGSRTLGAMQDRASREEAVR